MRNIINKLNTNSHRVFKISLGLLFAFLFSACNHDPMDVDVESVQTNPIKVMRLEQDLFKLEANNILPQTQALKSKYGMFYEYYLMNFLAPKGTIDSVYQKSVLNFTHDKDVRSAYQFAQSIYDDQTFGKIASEVNDCVKRFHYHFPTKKLPTKLITVSSGWNYAFAYLDSALVVALDMYLGDTCMLYGMLRYPQYQVRKMNKQNMVSDIVRGWMLSEFDKSEAGDNLLSHTIFYGKLFYTIQALMPDASDSLIIGYSMVQMDYCKKYEKQLWGFFAEKNRLYETNLNTVRELTSDGPFTGAIHKDCPPRIAMWVGWQIVRNYMKNNKTVTLNDLMKDNNAQVILNKSKYRP